MHKPIENETICGTLQVPESAYSIDSEVFSRWRPPL